MHHRPPGNRGSLIQRCNSACEPISRPFCEPVIHRTQEGYHRRTSRNRPLPPERSHAVRTFPDGGSPPCSPVRPRVQLVNKVRPQGHALNRADPSSAPPAPALQLGEPALRVSVPPVRPVQRPRVFTKLMKAPISVLRRQGIRLILYLDDLLLIAESRPAAACMDPGKT